MVGMREVREAPSTRPTWRAPVGDRKGKRLHRSLPSTCVIYTFHFILRFRTCQRSVSLSHQNVFMYVLTCRSLVRAVVSFYICNSP